MERFNPDVRSSMRCGYLPLVPDARAWRHAGDDTDERGNNLGPEVCPGYTTSLPEVIETTHARLHWEKGALGIWADGPVTEQQMQAVTVLEMASGAAQGWAMKNPRRDT